VIVNKNDSEQTCGLLLAWHDRNLLH
jgi:hypothetical protein